MILDEIEEMSTTLERVYDNMEQVYAIYIGQFPEKNATLDSLKQQLHGANLDTEGEHESAGPKHDAISGGQLIHVKQFDVREEMEESRQKQEAKEGTVEAEPDAKVSKMFIRVLFRKINQLCHPDKCRRFAHDVTARLRDCFVQAGEAYSNRDMDMLELVYMRVCYIRNELHRLDDRLVAETKRKHRMLLQQMEQVSFHPIYTVLQLHMNRMVPAALSKFEEFLDKQIQELKEKVGSQ